MRITSKGRYGLKAMMELAREGQSAGLLKTRVIAERQSIPLKYLEQIINILKRNKLVSSVRGSEGGYRLARPAADITVFEILQALEGDLSIIDQKDPAWGKEQGVFWQELQRKITDILSVPLSDFTRATTEAESSLMYYI